MIIDTHCHINMIVKHEFDRPLTTEECQKAQKIITEASAAHISSIINVGTSVSESLNCVTLAQQYPSVYATVGIHPNDCTSSWRADFSEIQKLVFNKEKNKIVGIGECGMDFHYPEYNKQRQHDAFKAQIELALEHDLALVVHTRDAGQETLGVLEEFSHNNLRGTIHCFSEDQSFADSAIAWGFVLGIGGTITYPKNTILREVVKKVGLQNIILETDAPFLPPQSLRGTQNTPANLALVAHYIAELLDTSFDEVAQTTTKNSKEIFKL